MEALDTCSVLARPSESISSSRAPAGPAAPGHTAAGAAQSQMPRVQASVSCPIANLGSGRIV